MARPNFSGWANRRRFGGFDRDWIRRAFNSEAYPRDPESGVEENESVRTESSNVDGREILYPTIRLVDGKLKRLSRKEARDMAVDKGDYIEFSTPDEATRFSNALSRALGRRKKGLMRMLGEWPDTGLLNELAGIKGFRAAKQDALGAR